MMLWGGLWVGFFGTVLLLFVPGAPWLGIPIVWAFVALQLYVMRSDRFLKLLVSFDRETYEAWFGEEESD